MRQDEDEYGKRNDQDRHKRKVGRAWTAARRTGSIAWELRET